MKTKLGIGILGEFLGWAISTNRGIILMDKNGNWFLGGNAVVALFEVRQDAFKIARKIKKERSDLIQWTKIIHVHSANKR